MSSFPKKAQEGGYQCQACYVAWEDPRDARDCCPPFCLLESWHCGFVADWCKSGLHFSEEEARRCMEQAVSERDRG